MIKIKQVEDLAISIQKAEDNAKIYADENFERKFSKNSAFNKNFGTNKGEVAEGNHIHDNASLNNDGFMSSEDKAKLEGIEANANNYVHPTTEGFKHLPSIDGQNNKILKVVDGNSAWVNLEYNDIQNKPNTLSGYGIIDAASKQETENRLSAIEREMSYTIEESDVDQILNFVKGETK